MTKFWSERIIFGLMIIGGYLALNAAIVFYGQSMVDDQMQLIRDSMLVLGPLLGMIVQAIWRTDKADKDNASTAKTLAEKMPLAQETSNASSTQPFDATITPMADGLSQMPADGAPDSVGTRGGVGFGSGPSWRQS